MKLFLKNKKYTFMIIFFICCFFFIGKAHALVYKGTEFTAFDTGGSFNGSMSNGSTILTSTFVSPIDVSNYDWLVIPFYEINFSTTNDFYIDNPYLNGEYNGFTFQCTTSSGDLCQYANILPKGGSSISSDLSGSMSNGSMTISAQVFNTNNNANLCFFNTNEAQIYCPTNDLLNINSLKLYINARNYDTIYYNITYYRLKHKYNNDSTEVVNALSQVQQQQVNTVTTIENFNNYVSNNKTSQSQTQSTTALSGLTNNFNSHLNQMNELTRLAFMPVNFILDIADSTCQPLVWDIPFVNSRVIVPCMSTIYNGYFSVVVGVFSTIMTSLITYRCCLKLFNTIKGVLDAEDDKIEVVDL